MHQPGDEPGTTSKCYFAQRILARNRHCHATIVKNCARAPGRLAPARHRRDLLGEVHYRREYRLYYKNLPPCTTAAQIGCLTDIGPAPGAYVRNPNVRTGQYSFFDDITRGYTQKAVFGSADFDIIPRRSPLPPVRATTTSTPRRRAVREQLRLLRRWRLLAQLMPLTE